MIASLAHRESGIKLAREKKLMVQSRLRHRLRALKLGTFSDYADHVLSQDGAEERRFMISALTTNVSHFFREAQHFELMSERLIPVFRKRMDRNERIRIWSAGCSNGQEPYSIAMHLLRQEPALASADFRILGTDIDPHVIRQAKTGRYTSSQLAGLAQADLEQFTVASGDSQPHRHMTEVLKKIVLFKELNLISDWPMRFTFDAIFCRNVVIYFDQVTQTQLWPKFSSALAPSGLFFLGHSERILSPDSYGFRSVGPTAYSKCCEVSGAAR
ncbi:CheR family methyltransferase [uncultured Tateyamaria sp.]|uniref:CheR family methyltransferase n=1 Tax=uncultured Tateyamaria sp. TaxID=455651 RepID=UPI00260E424C|nr:CheR family methyltransferase [uncultured Tateyamaria sp.]